MSRKTLDLIKFGEQEFRLDLNNSYFGRIKAIPNNDGTGYAVIYEQNIPAISGPPMKQEIYLESIRGLNELEEIARTHSKSIAQQNNYSLKRKANLSAKDPEKPVSYKILEDC